MADADDGFTTMCYKGFTTMCLQVRAVGLLGGYLPERPLNFVFKMIDFVSTMMIFVFKMIKFVSTMMIFLNLK